MKTNVGFALENPLASKLMESPDGLMCAELIREFLEFYRMDYTLQVFVPECNLPADNKVREKLEAKLGLKRLSENPTVPILIQIVQMVQQQSMALPQREMMSYPEDPLHKPPAAQSTLQAPTQGLGEKPRSGPHAGLPPENLFGYAFL